MGRQAQKRGLRSPNQENEGVLRYQASTSNTKRARIAGPSLAYSGPLSTPKDTTDHISSTRQLPSKSFETQQRIAVSDDATKEPTRASVNEDNGLMTAHNIDLLIKDDRNNAPAAIAASSAEGMLFVSPKGQADENVRFSERKKDPS